jgi:hypothetical protein
MPAGARSRAFRRRAAGVGGWIAAIWLCGAGPAAAHAFGQRYELPVPVWFFIVGGAVTVTLTFVMLGLFVGRGAERYAHSWAPLPRFLTSLPLRHAMQTIVGLGALLVLFAGLLGNADPNRNIAPSLVWLLWWVGLSYVAMLVGNPWPAIDPWRALFARFGPAAPSRPYPAHVGAWPSVALLLCLGWLELVFPYSSTPVVLAWLAVAYSLTTWAGMARYGADAWSANVDPFHRAFDLYGRFAPLAADGVRPHAARLLAPAANVPNAVAVFTLTLLAIVLFDGFSASGHWTMIENAIHDIHPRLGDAGWMAVHTVGLILAVLIVLALYGAACLAAGQLLERPRAAAEMARAFALSLIPIAVGYHFAHSFTFVVVQSQALPALLADPLGLGWKPLGARDLAPGDAWVTTRAAWYVAVTAIVLGHAISVYVAHVVALRLSGSRAAAIKCLLPMTLLMVVYTVISLLILAEPLVRHSPPQETII